MTTAPPLVVEDLAWGYDAEVPLGQQLNLTLDVGEAIALVGPNGAGKSTLLATVGGRVAPLRGCVRLGGAEVSRLSAAERARRVAVMPQELSLDPDLSVAELVELGRTPHLGPWGRIGEQDRAAVAQALDSCDLRALASRRLGQLSGGERQRAQLAMTVAQRAPVLLLDEPTTHLDLRRRHELFELLARLRQQTGVAVLMVLHDLREAYQEASCVVALSQGHAEAISASDPRRAAKLADVFGVPVQRIAQGELYEAPSDAQLR